MIKSEKNKNKEKKKGQIPQKWLDNHLTKTFGRKLKDTEQVDKPFESTNQHANCYVLIILINSDDITVLKHNVLNKLSIICRIDRSIYPLINWLIYWLASKLTPDANCRTYLSHKGPGKDFSEMRNVIHVHRQLAPRCATKY